MPRAAERCALRNAVCGGLAGGRSGAFQPAGLVPMKRVGSRFRWFHRDTSLEHDRGPVKRTSGALDLLQQLVLLMTRKPSAVKRALSPYKPVTGSIPVSLTTFKITDAQLVVKSSIATDRH
jgi:hypothetical protein